jgi:hypothetical protein
MEDKARLLALVAVTLLAGERGTDTNLDDYDSAFQAGCAALAASPATSGTGASAAGSAAVSAGPSAEEVARTLAGVQFLRRLLTLQGSPLGRFGGSSSSSSSLGLSSLFNSATSHATSFLTKLLAKFTPFYATRVVHSLAEGRGGPEDESFLTFDPRARDNNGNNSGNSNNNGVVSGSTVAKYSEVIVFVMGGGCYAEYFNLQELLREKGGGLRHIVYGCSDLLSGQDFLSQLQRLAAASNK